MSKGGSNSGGQQTTTGTSTTQLPDWITTPAKNNLSAAYSVSGNLLGPYAGPRVAGMPNGLQSDIATLQGGVGATNPAFAAAQDTAAGLTGYQPGQVQPGLLSHTDLSSYMNPFTQNVIASGMQGIDMQRKQALNGIADQANAEQAFGGSRQGVQEGITNAAASLQAGQLASQLENQNFTQAQQAAQGDINNNLQAQEYNAGTGLQGAGLNLNAANSLGALAQGGQSAFLQGTMGALQGQTLAQQQAQNQINAQQQAYGEAQQFPLQQLQIPESVLSQTPYPSTTNTTQTQSLPGGNGLLSGLGALSSGIGIMGSLFGGPAYAAGGGLLSGLLSSH